MERKVERAKVQGVRARWRGLRRGAAALILIAGATAWAPARVEAGSGSDLVASLVTGSGASAGTVMFTQEGSRVHVHVQASGLTPGFHGLHVHAVGSCVGPAFTSAGGHHNPGGSSHGSHAGDMPVLRVNATGSANESFTIDSFSAASLLDADGSAVVIHASPDNYANIPTRYVTTDPAGPTGGGPDASTLSTGDAGARSACGVVAAGSALPSGLGYWHASSDGSVYAFGDAPFFGSMGGKPLAQPIVGIAATGGGAGYWEVASDGGIFVFGDAPFLGSMGGKPLAQPIVGVAGRRSHAAARLVDFTGAAVGVATFTQQAGNVLVHVEARGLAAGFHGLHVHAVGSCIGPSFTSAGGHHNPGGASHGSHAGDMPVLRVGADGRASTTFTIDSFSAASLLDADGSAVIVHASPDNYANIPTRYVTTDPAGPTGGGPDASTLSTGDAGARAACGALTKTGTGGYWEVASDGGIFAFGDAGFFGSMGGKPLVSPVVGMAVTPTGNGYWEVASDGGIFAFGDAGFFGSMGGKPLVSPIVAIAPTPSGQGYLEVAADGGVFAFGDAPFLGSMGGKPLAYPIVDIAFTPSGKGYWLTAADGGVFAFGDAKYRGTSRKALLSPVVAGVGLSAP